MEEQFSCQPRGKTFSHKRSLNRHKNNVHDKLSRCDLCGKWKTSKKATMKRVVFSIKMNQRSSFVNFEAKISLTVKLSIIINLCANLKQQAIYLFARFLIIFIMKIGGWRYIFLSIKIQNCKKSSYLL